MLPGIRLTGAGFGGCTVNLVRDDLAADFVKQVTRAYHQQTGLRPEIYIVQPRAAASLQK
jgi:galactokinase